MARLLRLVSVICLAGLVPVSAAAQQSGTKKVTKAPVQKIRDGVYRVGQIEVDTIKKELNVTGKINDNVTVLEFVANSTGGQKAYESAITIDTDGVTFNTALLLLGLDPSHSLVPKQHFDPIAPKGDPVEIWVSWDFPTGVKRVRIEQLLYDERTKTTMPEGPWVYTGSKMYDGKYMADIDGVLIGFVHSPSPVIENPRKGAVDAYGSVVLNRSLGVPAGMKVTITVKAVSAKR